MTKEAKIIGTILVVAIIGIILIIAKAPAISETEAPKAVDPQYLVRENSHMSGKAGAKVTIVEFGDYQCPACGYASPAVNEILKQYGKNPDFNFVFRNFPLPTIHRNAMASAEAAEAAGTQGKFWEMNEMIYANQKEWSDVADPSDIFAKYAGLLGMDVIKFRTETKNHKYAEAVSADKKDGDSLEVAGTPTFFINGERQTEIPTLDEFKSKIDSLLKQ